LSSRVANDWLSLTVVDPTQGHDAFHDRRDFEWVPLTDRAEAVRTPATPSVGDD
jgi:hypothetical protein